MSTSLQGILTPSWKVQFWWRSPSYSFSLSDTLPRTTSTTFPTAV